MLTQADFAGSWRMARQIDDHLAGQTGNFTGTAVFAQRSGGVLDYFETGTMQFATGPALKAERRYAWTFSDGAVDVAFADGAPFHRFTPFGHAAGTDHPCGADFYSVRYDFTGWPDWTAVWTVTGPRKNYVSTTKYARLSGERAI